METTGFYRGYIGVIIGYILGLYRDNGKENGNCRVYRGSLGVMLGKYWGYTRMTENKMETTTF